MTFTTELKPEYSASHILLSQAYFNLSRYQKALDAAAAAIGLQDESAEVFCCRGKAAFKLGEYENAITDLTRSSDKDSKLADGEHFYWLAEARDAIGEKELAEAARKAATEAGFKREDREERSDGL